MPSAATRARKPRKRSYQQVPPTNPRSIALAAILSEEGCDRATAKRVIKTAEETAEKIRKKNYMKFYPKKQQLERSEFRILESVMRRGRAACAALQTIATDPEKGERKLQLVYEGEYRSRRRGRRIRRPRVCLMIVV